MTIREENTITDSGIAVWFTGLSGAGKSTLAKLLHDKLDESKFVVKELDGDVLRNGVNAGLGFTEEDRLENIRRAAEVAKLFIESNIITLCSFITPTEKMRMLAKSIVGELNYLEIFVKCSFEQCEKRDVKGLYKKARAGNIPNFTGISSTFEIPQNPAIIVDTEILTPEQCVELIYSQLIKVLESRSFKSFNSVCK